jgi:predicted DsbA family dithiol-disulfide isomerase
VADVAAVDATVFTDPYCPWSWAAEPQLRRLQVEFGDHLGYTFVIVGLRRTIEPDDARGLALTCLDASAQSGMPVDPRGLLRDPPTSTHPAGLAITAVAEQGDPAPFIRRLREAIMLEGRRMDSAPALLDAARETVPTHPGLDLDRLKLDFGSNAIVERFAADVERGRGVSTPTVEFADGDRVSPSEGYERLRARAMAAGAEPVGNGFPGVEEAMRRFGTMATPEVAAVCDLPGPRAPAELWRLALEWRVQPRQTGTGLLWAPA